jgi:hypothetical protein
MISRSASRTDELPSDDLILSFEHDLLQIFMNMISFENRALLSNVFDLSGDILLKESDLYRLLTRLFPSSTVDIIVDNSAEDVRCAWLRKKVLWTPIKSIMIDQVDFEIGFNKLYNYIRNYHVTWTKILK